MKKSIGLILFFVLAFISLPSSSWSETVKVEVIHSHDRYQAGKTYPIILRIKISKSLYIHGTKKDSSGLIPTVLSFREPPALKVEGIRFPEPERKKFDYTSKPIEVFSDDILVRVNLAIGEDAQPGEQIIKGNLSYQACSSNLCMLPEDTAITVSLLLVPQGTPTKALNQDLFLSLRKENGVGGILQGSSLGADLWLTLLVIFLGGLALNLTPCIYPLIPITVSYFSGKSQKGRGNVLFHGLLYIFGLAITNSFLGVSAALSGGMLGSALQNPFVLIFVAGILIIFGLSSFGFWEFRIPLALTRLASKSYRGLFGTFFMGLTLGIVAAPCIGPFILGLLIKVGQKGDPFMGFLYFFILSIGLGLPLCVLAIFSSAIDRLPVSGDWMLWIKKLLGWVLVGMAAYVISPLVPHHLGKAGLLAVLSITAGIHLGWLDRTGSTLHRFLYLKKILGIIIVGGGLIYLVSAFYGVEGIRWIPYDQDILSRAAKDKKPVILDFYADWCGPCRSMENRVFKDPRVVKLGLNFITMRLDLTWRQRFQEEILQQYRVRGVPTVIFFNREGIEEKRLRIESLVGQSEFIERMRWILEESPTFQK